MHIYHIHSAFLHSRAFFTPLGVRVTVFGTVYPTNEYNQRSQYVLDNEPTDLYYGPPNLTVIRYGVRYFESGNLTNTQHTLIITNLSERYILDFIQVLAPSNATPTDSFSSGSPTASFSSTPSLTTVSNGLDRASVVGIAVACSMGTLILVALGFVCYRWRRNMQRRNKGLHSPETSPHPFSEYLGK